MKASVEQRCPECGHDGPHPIVSVDEGTTLVECVNGCGEFATDEEG